MTKKIVTIIGHPDPASERDARALADTYGRGASDGGRTVQVVDIATLDFPLLRSQVEWKSTPLPASLDVAHCALLWARHIVIIYPLWLGDVPARLKAFLEQMLRPGDALSLDAKPFSVKLFSGKSARVMVTMGMPAWLYRWGFGAHSLKSLKRNILWFVGIGPTSDTVIGAIKAKDSSVRRQWLERMRARSSGALAPYCCREWA